MTTFKEDLMGAGGGEGCFKAGGRLRTRGPNVQDFNYDYERAAESSASLEEYLKKLNLHPMSGPAVGAADVQGGDPHPLEGAPVDMLDYLGGRLVGRELLEALGGWHGGTEPSAQAATLGDPAPRGRLEDLRHGARVVLKSGAEGTFLAHREDSWMFVWYDGEHIRTRFYEDIHSFQNIERYEPMREVEP